MYRWPELGGANAWLLHGQGLSLMTGRLVHAIGVSRDDKNYRFRVLGMAKTFAAIIVAAVSCLTMALVDLARARADNARRLCGTT